MPSTGHHLEGADDEERFRLCREHVDSHHPEMGPIEEQIRSRIGSARRGDRDRREPLPAL